MKNKVLWKYVDEKTNEIGFESEDLKKVAMVEMYMSQMQTNTLERIKKNIVFMAWILIIGLVFTIITGLSL